MSIKIFFIFNIKQKFSKKFLLNNLTQNIAGNYGIGNKTIIQEDVYGKKS